MATIKDFKLKHAPKIFAIGPAFSFNGSGCGYAFLNSHPAIFGGDSKVPLIHRAGLVKPFSSESSLKNIKELAERLKEIWHADAGFSSQPSVLVIELPVIDPNSRANPMSLIDLADFIGQVTARFSPKLVFKPTVNEWEQTKSKEETKNEIFSIADAYALKNINRDISGIAIDRRHSVYDAMGLGIYALRVIYGLLPRPIRCN